MTARLLVTGSRWLTFDEHGPAVERGLIWAGQQLGRDTVLVHGNCPTRQTFLCGRGGGTVLVQHGLDQLARLRWEAWGLPTLAYPADWDRHGRGAGMIRNGEMVDDGADLAMAWPHPTEKSTGTLDCARRAVAAGIRTVNGWTLEPICPCAPEQAAAKVHDGACILGWARPARVG